MMDKPDYVINFVRPANTEIKYIINNTLGAPLMFPLSLAYSKSLPPIRTDVPS